MKYTFEELRNGKIDDIPNASGVYWVLMPETFCMKYMEKTDGPLYNKAGKQMSYDINKLIKWGEHYSKSDCGGAYYILVARNACVIDLNSIMNLDIMMKDILCMKVVGQFGNWKIIKNCLLRLRNVKIMKELKQS